VEYTANYHAGIDSSTLVDGRPASSSTTPTSIRRRHTAAVPDPRSYRNELAFCMHTVIMSDYEDPEEFRKGARGNVLLRYSPQAQD
jgi:hypothetical protein